MGEFNWDAELQGIVLGAFFYGYIVSHIPGGIVAERYGAKWVVALTVFLSSLVTVILPWCATEDAILFIAMRAAQGFLEGGAFPAVYRMVAKWFPPLEKGTLMNFIITGRI